MLKMLKGVRVPHRKNTYLSVPKEMPPPKSVTLLCSMHIGKPAVPIVKIGDSVRVGQLIAEQNGFISSPVHASISGTVKKIDNVLISSGAYVPAVTIESDGLMEKHESVTPPVINTKKDFIAAVKASGIVGLGGAGFPTYVKLDAKEGVDTLIINGAECEPYITSDSVTLLSKGEDIVEAIGLMKNFIGIKKVIIGIEKNKKEAIENMKKLTAGDDDITVKVLPSSYPQGAEKVLIYNTTGKIVPAGKLPADVGCIVCNCTTAAEIAEYIKTGMPLVKKCVTVDGGAVKEPKNLIVPIGTSLADVFEFCGGFSEEPEKILYGGPMMGISVPSADAPVLKNTNAILAFGNAESTAPKTTACIHCGRCVNHCPIGLVPTEIEKAYTAGSGEQLEKLQVNLCMECGCCSYICPAKRPLVQTNKLAKATLRDYIAKKQAKAKEESGK